MGLPFSVFSKYGMPGVSSITTGQVYDRYFKDRKTSSFEDFHIAYVDFCKYFNTIMPGQDFDTPPLDQIKNFYDKTWNSLEDKGQKKEEFIKFMEDNVREATVDDNIFILAALAAPAGAIIAKKSSESIPQIKKLHLHIIPNVVFVPLVTLGAMMGATALQMSKKGKAKPAT